MRLLVALLVVSFLALATIVILAGPAWRPTPDGPVAPSPQVAEASVDGRGGPSAVDAEVPQDADANPVDPAWRDDFVEDVTPLREREEVVRAGDGASQDPGGEPMWRTLFVRGRLPIEVQWRVLAANGVRTIHLRVRARQPVEDLILALRPRDADGPTLAPQVHELGAVAPGEWMLRESRVDGGGDDLEIVVDASGSAAGRATRQIGLIAHGERRRRAGGTAVTMPDGERLILFELNGR